MSNLEKIKELCNHFTILYVEDDIFAQEGLAKTLRRIFDTVYVANDGEMGLDLFTKHRPDIIITDIQMPHLSGIDMAKSIKEIDPSIPIIVTTAFNEEQYFLRAIENGIDAFLFKPIDKDKLFAALFKNITHLIYQQKSLELEERKKVEKINQISEESIQSLANLFPFPTLFYKANHLIFINTTASQMLKTVSIESIQQETQFVSQFRITKDARQKIKLPTAEGISKVYWVYPNAFFMGVDFELVQTYIFVDITDIH